MSLVLAPSPRTCPNQQGRHSYRQLSATTSGLEDVAAVHACSHETTITMLALLYLISLLGALTTLTSATALTYKLTPNEKECFYTYVDKAGSKIAFYFAVQSGGSFDSAAALHGSSSKGTC